MVKSDSNDFFDGFNAEYTANNANKTGSMKCSKKNFEDINVAPGKDKVCWCDEDQKQMNKKAV